MTSTYDQYRNRRVRQQFLRFTLNKIARQPVANACCYHDQLALLRFANPDDGFVGHKILNESGFRADAKGCRDLHGPDEQFTLLLVDLFRYFFSPNSDNTPPSA